MSITRATIARDTPTPDMGLTLLVSLLASVATLAGAWAAYLKYWLTLPVWPVTKNLFIAIPDLAFQGHTLPPSIIQGLIITLVATLLVVIVVARWMIRITTSPAEVQLAGRTISDSPREALWEARAEVKIHGRGLDIFPGIPLSMERETRHFLVLGAPGGGKSTIIRPLIDQARARGDKSIIFDNKSDVTKALDFDSEAGGTAILVAPWDKRGAAWDVARDVQNKADSREFAAALIAEGKDPMWSNAARQVLVAMVRKCQVENPGRWGFLDLASAAASGGPGLKKAVQQYNPEASAILEDVASKTTQSVLTNLISFMAPIFDLADAWGRCQPPTKFSIRDWLQDDYKGPSTIILQGNQRFSQLQKGVSQALINAFSREMNSPAITDVRPDERRVWMFLDEFIQLSKLDNFSQFLEVGRSKGIRIVIGAQDLAQIKSLYGADTMETWASMVGSYIITRTQGVETPQWISDLIGTKVFKKYAPSYSAPVYSLYSTESPSRTDQYQRHEEPVIRPDEIASSLKATKKGVIALWLPGGETVYRLIWPHLTSEQKSELRPAQIPARWTAPDYPSARDQALAGAQAALPEPKPTPAPQTKTKQLPEERRTTIELKIRSRAQQVEQGGKFGELAKEIGEEAIEHKALDLLSVPEIPILDPGLGSIKIALAALDLICADTPPVEVRVLGVDERVVSKKKKRKFLQMQLSSEAE
uniref:type IV secretion system DNA-binding domain-containing protein n=1 Tax=Sedimenticola hydrogenitrophicus TaxID=2967975 RepID=UPI0023B172B0